MARRFRIGPLVILTLSPLAIAACGSANARAPLDAGAPDAAPPTLSVSPTTATTRAWGTPIRIEATLVGAEPARLTWTLTGPGSIVKSGGIRNDYTPPMDLAETATATVTAHLDALSASTTISVGPFTGVTVTGRVVDPDGAPASNFPVVIFGNMPVATDDRGAFTIKAVQVPYDIAVGVALQDTTRFMIYRGLTRLDPVLLTEIRYPAIVAPSPPERLYDGTVAGALSGGVTAPVPDDVQTAFTFEAPAASISGVLDPSGARYTANVNWDGEERVVGDLHALQWHTSGPWKLPSAFIGYKKRMNVSVSNGQTTSGEDVTLESVATDHLTGTVTLPAPMMLVTRSCSLDLGGTRVQLSAERLASAPGLSPDFSLASPHLENATIALALVASNPEMACSIGIRRGVATDAQHLSIELPAPPRQTAPTGEAANAVDPTTVFRWAGGRGVKVVSFVAPGETLITEATGPTPPIVFRIMTTGESTTLDAPLLLGHDWPSQCQYGWTVNEIAELTSVDEFVTEAGIKLADTAPAVSISGTPSATFTTK